METLGLLGNIFMWTKFKSECEGSVTRHQIPPFLMCVNAASDCVVSVSRHSYINYILFC